MDFLKRYRKMISLRGLTDHTMKSYTTYIKVYLDYIENHLHKYPSQVTWEDRRHFIEWLKNERQLSDRTINHVIAQIRFFTIYVQHQPWDESQLPTRKFDTYLPYVPTQEETIQFIDTIPDIKVKAMVSVMYSAGLRIGEVCNLRYEDIEGNSMRIHVTHGKNRQDRYAPLSQTALGYLTEYWYTYNRPTGWLFPKQKDPSRPIDTFFLSRHIHEHEDRLGKPRRLTCHSFRHALGTHLYENGTNLLTIQAILGHKSINSTTIYVHLANRTISSVQNPFDIPRKEHSNG